MGRDTRDVQQEGKEAEGAPDVREGLVLHAHEDEAEVEEQSDHLKGEL